MPYRSPPATRALKLVPLTRSKKGWRTLCFIALAQTAVFLSLTALLATRHGRVDTLSQRMQRDREREAQARRQFNDAVRMQERVLFARAVRDGGSDARLWLRANTGAPQSDRDEVVTSLSAHCTTDYPMSGGDRERAAAALLRQACNDPNLRLVLRTTTTESRWQSLTVRALQRCLRERSRQARRPLALSVVPSLTDSGGTLTFPTPFDSEHREPHSFTDELAHFFVAPRDGSRSLVFHAVVSVETHEPRWGGRRVVNQSMRWTIPGAVGEEPLCAGDASETLTGPFTAR